MPINRAQGFEGSPLTLMDRIYGHAGTAITQASLSAISYQAWEYSSEDDAESDTNSTAVGTSASLVVADTVFDTLQTDARWSRDSVGYNFRFTLPVARLPTGGSFVRVEVLFDPASGEDFPSVWIIEVLPMAGN
jgi:hypothetical protein